MIDILAENYLMFLGLYTALARTRNNAQYTYYKVQAAQRQYFINDTGLIFSDEQKKSIELLDEALTKFYYGAFALEQLWGVSDYLKVADRGLPEFYDTNITTHQNEIVFLLSNLLDQALYTWRSFLDFYLKYLLFFITGEYVITMSIKNYRKISKKYIDRNPDDRKAIQIEEYIKTEVLCQTLGGKKQCWGDRLRSLRDKTAHQQLIMPTLVEKENQQGFLITWPKIGGREFTREVQEEYENGAYEMIRDLFPVLYGFKWIPGPFKPGMYA